MKEAGTIQLPPAGWGIIDSLIGELSVLHSHSRPLIGQTFSWISISSSSPGLARHTHLTQPAFLQERQARVVVVVRVVVRVVVVMVVRASGEVRSD